MTDAELEHYMKAVSRNRSALLNACRALATVSSSDGSGHADLAVVYLVQGGYDRKEAKKKVEEWKSLRSWGEQ